MKDGEELIKKIIKLINSYTGDKSEDLIYALQGIVAQMAFESYSCTGEAYYSMLNYVHDFTAIQDWFGNRGIPLLNGDLKEWCYDGHFLYYTCNPSAPHEIQPDDEGDVVVATLCSNFYEPYTFIEYSKSPFANKIL